MTRLCINCGKIITKGCWCEVCHFAVLAVIMVQQQMLEAGEVKINHPMEKMESDQQTTIYTVAHDTHEITTKKITRGTK